MVNLIFDQFIKDVRVRVSGILVHEKKVLLISHKKTNRVYWLLPGGGVNFGETLKDALRREFNEELGVEVDVNQFAFICDSIDPDCKRHILNIVFKCTYSTGEYRLGNDKRLYDFNFFDKQGLPGLIIYPPIKDEIISIINGKETESYLGSLWQN